MKIHLYGKGSILMVARVLQRWIHLSWSGAFEIKYLMTARFHFHFSYRGVFFDRLLTVYNLIRDSIVEY